MREALWNLHMLCALEEQEVRLKYNVKFEHMMRKKKVFPYYEWMLYTYVETRHLPTQIHKCAPCIAEFGNIILC